eukprot:2416066-Rhodomonas_salina.9
MAGLYGSSRFRSRAPAATLGGVRVVGHGSIPPPLLLRVCYAMSGTAICGVWYCSTRPSAMRCRVLLYASMSSTAMWVCSDMSGTVIRTLVRCAVSGTALDASVCDVLY